MIVLGKAWHVVSVSLAEAVRIDRLKAAALHRG